MPPEGWKPEIKPLIAMLTKAWVLADDIICQVEAVTVDEDGMLLECRDKGGVIRVVGYDRPMYLVGEA